MKDLSYRNEVYVELNRNNEWQIRTDRGDILRTKISDDMMDWAEAQNSSEFRDLQKECFVKDIQSHVGLATMFIVYRPNSLWLRQYHDIVLGNIEKYKIWFLSTRSHTWITESDSAMITFNINNSLGDINNLEFRKTILYPYVDTLQKKFNPANLMAEKSAKMQDYENFVKQMC